MLTIGTHMSIARGIAKTAENVVKMEANTMQIFSRNPRGSNYKTYTSEEIGKVSEHKNVDDHWTDSRPATMNSICNGEKTANFQVIWQYGNQRGHSAHG